MKSCKFTMQQFITGVFFYTHLQLFTIIKLMVNFKCKAQSALGCIIFLYIFTHK